MVDRVLLKKKTALVQFRHRDSALKVVHTFQQGEFISTREIDLSQFPSMKMAKLSIEEEG